MIISFFEKGDILTKLMKGLLMSTCAVLSTFQSTNPQDEKNQLELLFFYQEMSFEIQVYYD